MKSNVLLFCRFYQTIRFKSDFDEDCKIVRKSRDPVKKEIVVIQSKVDKFLQANKPIVVSDISSKTSYESTQDDSSCDLSLEELILHEFQLIEGQTHCLDEWKSKFVIILVYY